MAATCQVTTLKAMNMVQVYIKGQEDKELSSFLRYYPVRIKNIGMDAFFDRQVIYDFKDGRNHADVAKCVAKMLVKKFGRKVRSVVFSCVMVLVLAVWPACIWQPVRSLASTSVRRTMEKMASSSRTVTSASM